MRKLFAALLLLIASATIASAQSAAKVVHSCGQEQFSSTGVTYQPLRMDTTDALCTNATGGGGGGNPTGGRLDSIRTIETILAGRLDSLRRLDTLRYLAAGRLDSLRNLENLLAGRLDSITLIRKSIDSLFFVPNTTTASKIGDSVFSWFGSAAPTVGSKTSANSIPVVIASDQAAVAVTLAGGSTKLGNVGDSIYYAAKLTNQVLGLGKGDTVYARVDTVRYNANVAQVDSIPTISNSCRFTAVGQTCVLNVKGKPAVSVGLDSSQSCTGCIVIFEVESQAADTNWDARLFWNGDALTNSDSLPNANGINLREFTVPVQALDVAMRLHMTAFGSGHVTALLSAGALAQVGGLPIPAASFIDPTIIAGGGYKGERATSVPLAVGGILDTTTSAPPARGRSLRMAQGQAPQLADPGAVIMPITWARVAGPTTRSSAGVIVQDTIDGYNGSGVGLTIGASTLVGTLVVEASAGLGSDTVNAPWSNSTIIPGSTLTPFTAGIVNPAASADYGTLELQGARMVRARISAYTSGSITVRLSATSLTSPVPGNPCLVVPTVSATPFGCIVTFQDTAATPVALVPTIRKNSTPKTTDNALVVNLAPQSAGQPLSTDTAGYQLQANATDSILLPAVAGMRYYIPTICWSITDSTTTLAGAAPDTLTTTNLPALPKLLSGNAASSGGQTLPFGNFCQNFQRPLVSSAQNTAVKLRVNATGLHTVNVLWTPGVWRAP